MPRLLYVSNAKIPTLRAHGFQISKMCEAFARLGIEVTLWHTAPGDRVPDRDLFSFYGIERVFEERSLRRLNLNRFQRILGGAYPAVGFSNSFVRAAFVALKAKKLGADLYMTRDPVLAFWLTTVGLPTVFESHELARLARRRLLARIGRASALRKVVITTRGAAPSLISAGIPSEKLITIPNGVDLAAFEEVPDREACRAQLGLPRDKVVIGYVGRFRRREREKGIPELIQAVAQLPPPFDTSLALCVGGPLDAVPHYQRLAEGCGLSEERLRFVDRVSTAEVPYWMRACDVLTIPWSERATDRTSSPLKIFEYMASGTPIVATDQPAIREILDDSSNAWLVQPGDVPDLSRALQESLTDRNAAMQRARHARSDVAKLTWQNRARRILEAANVTGLPP